MVTTPEEAAAAYANVRGKIASSTAILRAVVQGSISATRTKGVVLCNAADEAKAAATHYSADKLVHHQPARRPTVARWFVEAVVTSPAELYPRYRPSIVLPANPCHGQHRGRVEIEGGREGTPN